MKISLRKQLIISFSAIFIVLIVLFGGLILKYNMSNYQKQSYEYILKIVKANIHLIDNYFEQLINVSKIIANDPAIVQAVTYRNSVSEIDYAIELYNQRDVAAKIKQLDVLGNISDALIIGNRNEYLYFYGRSPVKGYNFAEQDWYAKATVSGDKLVRFTGFHPTDYLLNSRNKETVSILTPIFTGNPYQISKRSYLMCDFNLDPIISGSSGKGNSQIAIFDGVHPIHFSGAEGLSESQKEEIAQALAEEKKSFILSKSKDHPVSYLVVNETSTLSGWSILGIMPLTEIEQMRATNTSFVVIMIVIACMLVLILSGVISRSILIPMNSLIMKLNDIAAGNRDVVFKKSKSVEINSIAATAQHMLMNINQLTDEILEEHKKLAQEQLKVLQHQINPHFLNNVLQSIKAMAVCGDVESISRATTLLGKILSYSVYNPYEQVPLKDELAYIENYMSLQNIRFNHTITYDIDCDEKLEGFLVPKLMIQPLVENAIEHGFSHQGGGHIAIVTEDAGQEFYIAVTNNGMVMDTDEVNRLNEMLGSQDTYKQNKSIGLLNLNQRLKSRFGPKAGLKLFSREGMNTSIVITIPKS